MELIGELPPVHVWKKTSFHGDLNLYLDWLEKQGVREILWTPEPAGFEAASLALRGRPFRLTAVLPNMSLYARDAMDRGPTGAVLKRFAALAPVQIFRLGLRLLPRAPALIEKRFSAGIMLLIEAEFLRLRKFPVDKVVLHNSLVDLALAFGCRELFEEFLIWTRGRGVEGLFMTNNLGFFASRTKQWNMNALVAVTPVNAKGYLMQPDRASVEAYCKAHSGRVVAIETGSGTCLESVGISRATIPWDAYRPKTIAERLANWKKRAQNP